MYLFDFSGTIRAFHPIHLTKYNNEEWDGRDIAEIRSSVLLRNILAPFTFDPQVDAVSTATITSSVIFNSLSHGRTIFEELNKKGLLNNEPNTNY